MFEQSGTRSLRPSRDPKYWSPLAPVEGSRSGDVGSTRFLPRSSQPYDRANETLEPTRGTGDVGPARHKDPDTSQGVDDGRFGGHHRKEEAPPLRVQSSPVPSLDSHPTPSLDALCGRGGGQWTVWYLTGRHRDPLFLFSLLEPTPTRNPPPLVPGQDRVGNPGGVVSEGETVGVRRVGLSPLYQ